MMRIIRVWSVQRSQATMRTNKVDEEMNKAQEPFSSNHYCAEKGNPAVLTSNTNLFCITTWHLCIRCVLAPYLNICTISSALYVTNDDTHEIRVPLDGRDRPLTDKL